MSAPAAPLTARPAVYGLVAIGLLTLMDAVMKAVSGPFSAVQILWLRFALTAAMAGLLLVAWRLPFPAPRTMPRHLLRAVMILISNGTFIYALGALPLAEVFALALTAPLFLAALGAITLKETVTKLTLLGLALGFCGMLVIVFGEQWRAGGAGAGGTHPPLAVLAALVAPVTYAIGIVLLRQQATGEAPAQVVFVQALLVTVLVAPFVLASSWSTSPLAHWPAFLAIGATSTAGYLILVAALAGLTAVRYSVIEYTGLLWAGLIGWLWFAEQPSTSLLLGSLFIFAGALTTVFQREAVKEAAESATA